MHQHIINASIQIVPIVQDRHPYEWVDEAILIIKSTRIKCEVGAFATVVEGTYDEVMDVIHQINDHLQEEVVPNGLLMCKSRSEATEI